jgi:molybdenum cofactor cytidylyltransferase
VFRVAAILLAAGESTRMGRTKALLPWQSTTLVEHQLNQLSSVHEITAIIVVTGHAADEIVPLVRRFPGALAVYNADHRSGKVSSIRAGLAAVPPGVDAVLLLAVDQPRPADVLRRLVHHQPESGAAIIVPVHRGRRGHPVLFAASMLPELHAISEETHGIREVLRRHADAVSELPIDDPIVLLDLNRPSDIPREPGKQP